MYRGSGCRYPGVVSAQEPGQGEFTSTQAQWVHRYPQKVGTQVLIEVDTQGDGE